MNLNNWDISYGDKQHIIDSLQPIPMNYWSFIRNKYNKIKRSESRRNANLYLLQLKEQARLFNYRLATDNDELADKAQLQVKWSKGIIDREKSSKHALERIQTLLNVNRITLGNYKTIGGTLSRLTDEKWWRRKLRKHHSQAMEAFAREIGMVNSKNQIYVSNASVERRRIQKLEQREFLSQFEIINELGEIFDLDKIVDKSVSNPEIRRYEMMCRIAGNEALAQERGFPADFLTITAPGKMHAHYDKSGDSVPHYDGSGIKHAQSMLQKQWTKIRSALKRQNLECFGVRVTEPHKDGTPHWHLLIFTNSDHRDKILTIFKHYALEIEPDEKGADKHRFKVMPIDYSKGSATGYIAKYISKNIDGYMLDESDKTGAKRVEAWASTWGIRQFQFFGNPPVSIWRELRRLESSNNEILDKAIRAADTNNWADFMKLMGGPGALRSEMPIRLHTIPTDKLNDYGEPVSNILLGVKTDDNYEISRDHDWVKVLKDADTKH